MVQRFSAQLYLPFEHRIPVEKNHIDIVKFDSEVDPTYQTVVRHIQVCTEESIAATVSLEQLLYAIESLNLEHLLRLLSTVDQEKHKTAAQSLDYDSPQLYWIFRNKDYHHWLNSNCSQVLWLLGPLECRIRNAASHIVDLWKSDLGERISVLYFFCSSAAREQYFAIDFIRAIILQIVHDSPSRKDAVITVFLRTLFDAILNAELVSNPKQSHFQPHDSPDTIIKKTFDAFSNDYWDALTAVLHIVHSQRLFILIDGLHKIEHQKDKFLKEFREFIEHVQEDGSSTIKVLLTSRPQDELKAILDGMPYIEYDKERRECLNTLQFKNTRYDNISDEHEGSLQWLWTHQKYQEWSSTDTSDLLLIEGKPGSGKSTLTKYFKRNILEQEPHVKNCIIAGFHYSYRDGELQTDHSNMLRSILYEILFQEESFFFHFQTHYRNGLQPGTPYRWSYDSLKKIVESFRDHPAEKRLYFIIDAMDESDETDRRDILSLLRRLCSTKTLLKVKIFLASRPIAGLDHRTTGTRVIKLQEENERDIFNFAQSFLGPELELPSDVISQAREYIVSHAQGVFIWVYLVKEELVKYSDRGCSQEDIFEFLKSLPTELEGFYKRILYKLKEGNKRDVMDGFRMFYFVLFAYRPLRVEELQHALCIPDIPDATFLPSDASFNTKLIYGINKRIIHCGGNLLETKGLSENQTVQVMHQTVREFFWRPNSPASESMFHISRIEAHARISITCIRYLILFAANGTLEKELPSTDHWTMDNFKTYTLHLNNRPLINYVLDHLENHLDSCGWDENVTRFISQLVHEYSSSIGFFLLERWARSNLRLTLPGRDSAESFRNNVLQTAALMGFTRVIEALLRAGADVDARLDGKTALIVSAQRGEDKSVQLLIDWGADKEANDSNGRTALHHAAANGHDSTVRLLIQTLGVNKEASDTSRRTALHLAAANSQESTVCMLVTSLGADKEAKDSAGQTALHHAALNGYNSIVEALVKTLGANKDSKDRLDQTPLHLAASNGNDSTVCMLCDTLGANIEAKDHEGKRPLHHAASNGHCSTVHALVSTRGADMQAAGPHGWRALHFAAANGNDSTVQLLVQTLGDDMEATDPSGRTALHHAVSNGYISTAQLLMQTLGANKEAKDYDDMTALHYAASNGQFTTIRMLIETAGADPEAKDKEEQTALHLAASNGHCDTVNACIERFDVNKEAKDRKGQTPLHHAASKGHYLTVQTLCKNLGANKEPTDNVGMTPLHHAALNGHDDTLNMLINNIGVTTEATNMAGMTALHCAAASGHDGTVKLLVEHFRANANAKDRQQRTALHFAVESGHLSTVQLLINTLNANTEARNAERMTALDVARNISGNR